MNVDLHNSWLVVNSIRGCTNGCKYCFLGEKLNGKTPNVYCTPKEVVQEILRYRYYDEKIPICLFPNTDIFLNERNIQYLLSTIREFVKQNVKNDFVIITKCLIPRYVLKYFKRLQSLGYHIVVYLSYSGLDQNMEPGVNHKNIFKNFKMLKRYHIPCIHYFRPLVFQNSNKDKILQVLDDVHPYTSVSVVAGLMVQNETVRKLFFGDSMSSSNLSLLKSSSSVYPMKAWNFLFHEYHGDQSIFQTNTCAFHMVLGRPCSMYFCSKECIFFNSCSRTMRMRCQRSFHLVDYQELSKKISYYFTKLKIDETYSWKFSTHNTLQLIGRPLEQKTLTFLSFVLGITVVMLDQDKEHYYSSLRGRPFIYKEEI